MTTAIDGGELWLLSYYRHCELGGALFFGRLARVVRPGRLQHEITRQFADEARHADLWGRCLDGLGLAPVRVANAYQDRYLDAAGLPASLMEVLAVTHVFERRAFRQYVAHARRTGTHPAVRAAIGELLADERRHLAWVRRALRDAEEEHGRDEVRAAVARYDAADREIHAETLAELAAREMTPPAKR